MTSLQAISGGELGAEARVRLLRQAIERRPESASLLFDLAGALADVDQVQEAVAIYRRMLALRGATTFPGLKLARALVAGGVLTADVIAGLAIAEGAAGNEAEVRRLIDCDRFLRCRHLDAPSGYASETFHTALAGELRSDLTYYDDPEDHATRQSWRNDRILHSRHPAWLALVDPISAAIREYIDALPADPTHPFLASVPAEVGLRGWALVSRGAGYLKPHYHHMGWMTAVYYVARPPPKSAGDRDSWLCVGPPDDFGQLAGWEERLIEPKPGTLVMMPAYFFHSTRPSGLDQERICVVLDVAADEARSVS
jgi:hypothetical protein